MSRSGLEGTTPDPVGGSTEDARLREVAVSAGGGSGDYAVHVGRGSIERLPSLLHERSEIHRWAVISDETVASHHAHRLTSTMASAGLDAPVFTFPAGERHKNRETWVRLTDALLAEGLGRDSGVLALGGGVTGDLAGFVAATLFRGVPVVQLPTSLVAMIDASVGGKTGVDTPAGKNLVGAFHPPAFVLIDPEFLATLPRWEKAQGLVEALKHGLILDRDYLRRLEDTLSGVLAGDLAAAEEVVLRSVQLKAGVVSRDEREGGYRQILNFGHTLGHALEAASGYELSHGSAVGLGMILEARLGEQMGVTESGVSSRIEGAVSAMGLPATPAGDTDLDRVRGFLRTDKKRRGGKVRFVLLRRVGEVAFEGEWSRPVAAEAVDAVLREAVE